ncbi:MAG: GatB/YqeY domain-containing protein [Thermodesulfobacteriota bacterium]
MSLAQKVEADLKTALKSKDELATSCLRLVRAALKNQEKELRRPLNEEEDIRVLSSLAKQRRESIEQFAQGGRQDLVDREKAELAIIEGYLPAQLDEAGIAKVLDEVFASVAPAGMKDMGRVMKEAMAKLAGQADGKLVNQLVRQRLQSS